MILSVPILKHFRVLYSIVRILNIGTSRSRQIIPTMSYVHNCIVELNSSIYRIIFACSWRKRDIYATFTVSAMVAAQTL